MQVKLLDIPFSNLNQSATLSFILSKIKADEQIFCATPNPEMLLETMSNSDFKKLLQNTDLNIPDGIGLLWASFVKKNPKQKYLRALQGIFYLLIKSPKLFQTFPERLTGTDLFTAICLSSEFNHYSKFLLGGGPGIAEAATNKILTQNKFVNIVATSSVNPENPDSLNQINQSKAAILFVAYGSPKQELWIQENLPKLPHVKFAIGIGGAFDFVSGKIPRAPSWMRSLGLEWLFRLFKQPTRIKRIYNAVIKFPLKFLRSL